MLSAALITAFIAGSANAQIYPTGTMGPTNPLPTTPTEINQNSDSRLLSVNSADDWCLYAPPEPNSSVGDVEGEVVAWCTKPRNNARLIPDGTITAAHYYKTPAFVQITALGKFDQFVNVLSGDAGGELDPHGATGEGNPVGGNVTALVDGNEQSYEEWMSFISSDMFCARICTADAEDWSTAQWCEHKLDEMGCAYVMPASYEDNVFESCDADVGYPPGVYPNGDGSYSTFAQYYAGSYTGADGQETSYEVGTTVTPTAPATTPASSNCQATPSPSNGIDIQNPPSYPAAPTNVAQADIRYDLLLHPSGNPNLCLAVDGQPGNDVSLSAVDCDNQRWNVKRGGPALIKYSSDNNYCIDAGNNQGKIYTCYDEQPNQHLYLTDDQRIAIDGGQCLTFHEGETQPLAFEPCTDNNQLQVFSN